MCVAIGGGIGVAVFSGSSCFTSADCVICEITQTSVD